MDALSGSETRMYRYRVSGLSVSSDIELPGLFAGLSDSDSSEIVIARGAVPEMLDGAVATGPTWAMAPGKFLLRIPGIVRFLLNEGRSVVYEDEGQAAPGDASAFLLGTVFGILLHQREQIVLHASGI